MRKIGIIFLLFFMISLLSAELETLPKHEENLHHAETFYWLGINEQGDMQAFEKALDYLHDITIPTNLDSLQKAQFIARVSNLKQDILFQQDMAHDTFGGVFPLTRLMGNTIFSDAGAAGSFEFVDDPDVIAVSKSAEALLENMQEYLKLAPQFGLVFNSKPQNTALENEIRYIFNSHDKFYIHNDMELAAVLSIAQFDSLKTDQVSPEILNKLFNNFSDTHLLTITINEIDIVDDVYFYNLEAKAYRKNNPEVQYSISNLMFCRDKREAGNLLLWITIGLFLLSLLLFNLFKKNQNRIFWGGNLIIPVLAFSLGRFLPWILTPLISTFRPEPEVLVMLSLWWLMLFGVTIICGSMLAYWLINNRLKKIFPILAADKQLSLSLLSLGLGLSAYISSLIIIYDVSYLPSALCVIISISAMGMILGSALDRLNSASSGFIIFVFIFSLFAGPAIAQMVPLLHYIMCAVAILGLVWLFWVGRKPVRVAKKTGNEKFIDSSLPENAEALSERALNPVYQKFESYEKCDKILNNGLGKSRILAISGSSGKGKSALAHALICELQSSEIEELVILKGECPNEESHLNPFAPIQQALGSFMGINLSSAVNTSSGNIDSLLDGLLDSVIPFSSLLIPNGDNQESAVESKGEIHEIIFRSLVKLAKCKRVLLYLDDVHWIDDSSNEFLAYLVPKLKNQTSLNITLLLTSRETGKIHNLGIEVGNIVTVESLKDEDREQILHSGLGLEEEFAKLLLSSIGKISDQRGELFFLLNTVAFLARVGAFQKTSSGFILAEKYSDIKQLPIPGAYSETVKQQVETVKEHRSIIACAACLGLEFSAAVLASCLEISRFSLLQILDEIEQKTGLIYDVRDNDDIYAFQSSFSLEILREYLQITNVGPSGKNVPQLVREYHYRVAISLENLKSFSVFDVAQHYFAAGASNAEKGLEYCIKAARASSSLFQHDNSRKYLSMARECAAILGKKEALEEEFLLLELNESHVENSNQQQTADRCLAVLKNKINISKDLRIPLTRCFYEAGVSSRDQKYFTLAVELGKQIVSEADNDLQKAEAFQFIGLSLAPSDKETIIKNLEESRLLLLPLINENLKAKQLLARVENSLAEKLTYPPNPNKKRAEELFSNSIKIKTEFSDKPGLARSYGGLGRLLVEEMKYTEAEEQFRKDLEICEEIQDLGGVVKMLSQIADCKMKQNDFDAALEMYESSYQKAGGLNDRLFAARGYIIASGLSIAGKRSEEFGNLLLENQEVSLKIWPGFFDEVLNAIKGSALEESDWFQKLQTILKGK